MNEVIKMIWCVQVKARMNEVKNMIWCVREKWW